MAEEAVSGEFRMVRDALKWGLVSLPIAALIGAFIKGSHGAASAATAFALVLLNIAVSASIVTFAARKNHLMAAGVALPSYVTRMAMMTAGMWLLLKVPFIDKGTFLASICVAVAGTLALEARTYKRTPWAALTFMGENKESM
ncbi:MAG: hypothetical protein ACYDCC_09310 [Actinomycetota bacterium]